MEHKEPSLGPVLIGGVAAAILSAIPIINYCNLIFCMWMLLGAGLAVKLLQDKTNAIEVKEGAVIGLLTGLVTGGVFGVIYILVFLLFGAAMIPGAASGELEGAAAGTGMMALIMGGSCIGSLVVYGGFGALGGVIAAAIFKPKVDGPPGSGGFGPPGGGFGQPPGGGFGQPPGGGFGQPPGGGAFGPPQGGGAFGPPQGGPPPGSPGSPW